jgi:hypothetical protein
MQHNAQPDPTEPHRVDSWPALRAWRLAIHGTDLTPRAKLIGLLVADHINHTRQWQAWPAQATLATLSGDGDDRRNVRRNLAELVTAGWLTVTQAGGPRRSARYALSTPTGVDATPVTALTGVDATPITVMGVDTTPADGVDTTPADGVDTTPRIPRTTVRKGLGNSESQDRGTSGADPARAYARPVAPSNGDREARIAARLALYGGTA